MLPVPYTPPPRYTSNTPIIGPVIVHFIRAGAILMLDWVSLRFIENAPPSVYVASAIIALLILAIVESRDWLNFKGRWYFTISLITLSLVYGVIIAFAYVLQPGKPQAELIKNPIVEWNGGTGPIVFHAQYSQTGQNFAVFVQYGSILASGPIVAGQVNWEKRRFKIDFKERFVRDEEIESVIGTVSNVEGGQLVLQIGAKQYAGIEIGITWASYVFQIILVSQNGTEESYQFAIISSRHQSGDTTPIMIIGPSVFTSERK
jgi:hypothetical protein